VNYKRDSRNFIVQKVEGGGRERMEGGGRVEK
jgi:hypothetical protein